MNHELEFRKALTEFLQHAIMVPLLEEEKLTRNGDYNHLCFMTTYRIDDKPHCLLVPTICWQSFLIRLRDVFDSKINKKLIQSTLQKTVCRLSEFPFTEESLLNYAETIFQVIWPHFQLNLTALVPLHNIRVEGLAEIPLANAALFSGHQESILANITDHPRLQDCSEKCFLQIQVSGDSESRLRQVNIEVERSLAVLRFITMWLPRVDEINRVKYNPASSVTMREQGKRHVVYYKPGQSNVRSGFFWESAPRLFFFTRNEIQTAYEFYGLRDINYHFNNSENPISHRIVRALELYDSGVRASSNWQSLYRYVVSINVVIPKSGSKGKNLTRDLTTLIQYGGSYTGSMKVDDKDDPDTITWDEMVTRTAEPFERFYILRDKILHGNLPLEELSDEDTEGARVLAHNAIRLMAFLARHFNWQTEKEMDRWFRSPQFPPDTQNDSESDS